MKRKRKVWYEIEAEGMWWCGKKYGWVKDEDLGSTPCGSASSSRVMRTAQKAFFHVIAQPAGSVLTRWFYKKGCRWSQEFVRR